MSAILDLPCDGIHEDGSPCDATCDPHIEERNRRIGRQRALTTLALRLQREGRIDDASLIYGLAEEEWDDALHFPSPYNGHVTLCGRWGRNIVPLDDSRDEDGSRCWSCLHERDRLAASVRGTTP